jgi:Cd2+/Zn2+-exporting ATPase
MAQSDSSLLTAAPDAKPGRGSTTQSNRRSSGIPAAWWAAYQDVILSTESLASLVGLGFLVIGWITIGLGSLVGRWWFLSAALVAGAPILKSCITSLVDRRISVEVLVGLAITASVVIGEFHAGAVVAVMLLGGGVLEQITIARARRSVRALLANTPEKVLVRRDQGDGAASGR